jgi:hypothetical protein
MIQNKIVIRYLDGRMQKGITNDFFPNKESFHVVPAEAAPGDKPQEVRVAGLKAVFFVKEFGGIPGYKDKKAFEPGKPIVGRKIKVLFKDGELMLGTTNGYQPDRPGFFVNPADTKSNVERCFVVTKATTEITLM